LAARRVEKLDEVAASLRAINPAIDVVTIKTEDVVTIKTDVSVESDVETPFKNVHMAFESPSGCCAKQFWIPG
jgi:hypothetical protein